MEVIWKAKKVNKILFINTKKIKPNFAEPMLKVSKKFKANLDSNVSLKIPVIMYEPDHKELSW